MPTDSEVAFTIKMIEHEYHRKQMQKMIFEEIFESIEVTDKSKLGGNLKKTKSQQKDKQIKHKLFNQK